MDRRETMIDLAKGVANDDSHGYSQYRRFPWQGTDFDCSSLMYWAAHEAGYDVPLSGYTGTMLADFQAAGFTAVPWDGNIWDCTPGDILLAHNDNRQHTEMYVGQGCNVGAHIAETGDIDGAPGDQTGNEISVSPNWGVWDWVLIPPDGYEEGLSGSGSNYEPISPEPHQPSDAEWQGDMIGLTDTTGSGDDYAGVPGKPILDVAIDGVGEYQVSDAQHGDFWPCVDHYDLDDPEDGYAGDDCPIDRLRIFDPTVNYQLREIGGDWYTVMRGTFDTGGSGDDFAGERGKRFDLLRIWREDGEQPRYNVFS